MLQDIFHQVKTVHRFFLEGFFIERVELGMLAIYFREERLFPQLTVFPQAFVVPFEFFDVFIDFYIFNRLQKNVEVF